jgi:Holliday junction DNA helicase RuvA
MIHFIRGILVQSTPGIAVVEAGGIGYKVLIPASTYPRLPQVGEEILLHTSLVVREISQTLYGFSHPDERDLFEELTTVSGVGPKIALSLIGHLSVADMHSAIGAQDITMISKVPGIGKKTAQRLIIELRDRLQKSSKAPLPSDFAIQMDTDPRGQKVADAMSALINLGYNQSAAQKALKKSLANLPETIDLPELITDALKNV